MNRQHVQVLARYEFAQAFSGARGILFLIIYATVWFWFLWKLTGGWAANLATKEGLAIASFLLDPDSARTLFAERPPTLSLFFLLFMACIPWFTMWGAGDQTASDIGTRHLRYLIPRCGRTEIYLGRFLGALAFMVLVQTVIVGAGVMVAWLVDGQASVAGYGARVWLVVLAYTLPFVALMSLFGALIGSAAASILGAVAAYAVVAIAGGLLARQWEVAGYLGYLFPAPLKAALLTGEGAAFIVTLCAMALYGAGYFLLGWYVFNRRDI